MANPRTIARLQERIRERAAYCLQFEVNDPRASFITITRVELASDIGSAKIFYSVLGDEADKTKAEHMLKHAGGFIQRQVARVLDTRRIPQMRWYYDGSAEQAADLGFLIREAREKDRLINPSLGTENEFAKPDEEAGLLRPKAEDLGGDDADEDGDDLDADEDADEDEFGEDAEFEELGGTWAEGEEEESPGEDPPAKSQP